MKKAIRDMEPGVDVFIFANDRWTVFERVKNSKRWFWCKPIFTGKIEFFHKDHKVEIIGRMLPDGIMEEIS